MRGRLIAVLLLLMLGSVVASGQTTIYLVRDHLYAGPGGGEIATVTPAPSDTTAPTAPSSLGVTSTTATSVALSWTGSTDSGSGLAGYKIYRQKGSGANLPAGTVNSSTTAFTDQPLEPSTSYSYTIVAFDNAQNHSSASNSVNPTTSASTGDSTAPSAPPNLRGIPTTRQSTYKVRLDWDSATDGGGSAIAGYKVYRGGTLISGGSAITNRYYEDSTNTAKTSFTYEVKAVDGAGNLSGYSNAVSVTTLRQLVLFEDFNHADYYYDFDDFVNLNNTLQQVPRATPGGFADYVASNSENTFAAAVKVLARDGAGVLNSGLTFWATPVSSTTCTDASGYDTLWEDGTGLYRVYEENGGYLVLQYWGDCTGYTVYTLATSAAALPSGPGTLTLDVNHSTRRIKAYWNGVVKIDHTDTNTSRPNSGAVALTAAGWADPPPAIFDDFLVEK